MDRLSPDVCFDIVRKKRKRSFKRDPKDENEVVIVSDETVTTSIGTADWSMALLFLFFLFIMTAAFLGWMELESATQFLTGLFSSAANAFAG